MGTLVWERALLSESGREAALRETAFDHAPMFSQAGSLFLLLDHRPSPRPDTVSEEVRWRASAVR